MAYLRAIVRKSSIADARFVLNVKRILESLILSQHYDLRNGQSCIRYVGDECNASGIENDENLAPNAVRNFRILCKTVGDGIENAKKSYVVVSKRNLQNEFKKNLMSSN